MTQLSLFETQNALLALFGLEGEKLITRLQLDMKASALPTLTVEKYVDLSTTPSLASTTQRFELFAINEPAARPAFDLDAACKAATQRVLNHIEDQFTVHSRVIAHDFGAARDHMRSRHQHQKAMQASRSYVSSRSFITAMLEEVAGTLGKAHA